MEREYGVTIDFKKSSTLSVSGTFNPLLIIKKLNFNHSTIESRDKETKSPEKLKITSPIQKNNFLNLNYNSNNNDNKTPNNPSSKPEQPNSNIISNLNFNKQTNTENNNLLKSIRTLKNKKEITEMQTTLEDFNVNIKRNLSLQNFASPVKNNREKTEKAEKSDINSTDFNNKNKITEKIFEKMEKRTNNFTSNRRDRERKIALPGKSGLSEKNEFPREKENSNNSAHLEIISEKGNKKKKKKDRELYNKNINKDKDNAGVILPKIINASMTNNNNKDNNKDNKECNISSSKNEEEKNVNGKEALRKNYSQSIAHFRKTSESAFAQKRAEANNSANSNFGYFGNNYTNRYTSVMKSYREKKLHLFDKNKFFYVIYFINFFAKNFFLCFNF